ncbi:nucleoside ABC transporter membrane protein [Enhydrobacter aerosaccus]|uniref:Nucleoside ABC transporter membrane protein n=1 Tax=Enhydrobacter aerosaccus TaxID=225324 RepID=A0A1T4P6D3_9HYPH|nr:ABC transporter permease [Enhydrobacter aerosaccus]SJZ87093.1 nucleoside ABC transporter membrane protein [Enhydrobacter aerosaccus]
MTGDLSAFVFLMLAATVRTAAPLILCAMGGLFSERSGIVDVGLEGKMLTAAFFAAAVSAVTGSAWWGVAAAIAAAEAMALLHGLACITYRGNQVVSGVALNILAAGLTVVLGNAWFARGGQTPALDQPGQRLMPLFSPRAGDNILVYVALLSVPLTWWLLARTRFGLRLRAVGEMPLAVDAAGISVGWLRYLAVLLCGLLSGLAGAYLSIAQNAGFSRDMTAGQGFIALAAIIFGKWRPVPAFGACLVFGLLDAVAIRLQGVRVPGFGEVPVQLIQALPYLLTMFLLAGFIGRAVAPKAIGIPYEKEP